MNATFKKVNKWSNETLYHCITDVLTMPFTVQSVRDKKGTLHRIECSLTGMFETYSMSEGKQRILNAINTKQ